MFKKRIIYFAMVLFVLSGHAIAAEKKSMAMLKSFLKSTRSLTADFKQITINENGIPVQTSYGDFYLDRPGKFRWNYKKPFQQEIVSNKGKVWFYDADLEQVTVRAMDDSIGSTPALLLSGEVPLEDNFIIQQQGVDEDLQWIKLSPKNEQSGFKYILLGFDQQGIGGMELSDNFGQLTRIYFSNVKKNPQLKAAVFEFKVPEGVDVFSNE